MCKNRRLEHDIFGTPPREESINSKNKGDRNENALARMITIWTGVKFTRVPRSGGLDWSNNDTVYGDIVCTDQDFDFIFSVETKFYKNISLGKKKITKRSIVFRFWEQCVNDAKRSNRVPILFLRRNGMPSNEWFVYLKYRDYRELIGCEGLPIVVSAGNKFIDGLDAVDCDIVGVKSSDLFKFDYQNFVVLQKYYGG